MFIGKFNDPEPMPDKTDGGEEMLTNERLEELKKLCNYLNDTVVLELITALEKERERVALAVEALESITQFQFNKDGTLMTDSEACTAHVIIARVAKDKIRGEA